MRICRIFGTKNIYELNLPLPLFDFSKKGTLSSSPYIIYRFKNHSYPTLDKTNLHKFDYRPKWWSQPGSNRRPSRCERDALPTELWPQNESNYMPFQLFSQYFRIIE
jgi:hypothetical protein